MPFVTELRPANESTLQELLEHPTALESPIGSSVEGVIIDGIAVDAEQAAARIHALTTMIDWKQSVDAAIATATEQQKLICFVHMHGEINGCVCSGAHSMRSVTYSHPRVLDHLERDYVCGWRDIQGEAFCGNSGIHPVELDAVHTTNGAGAHNNQLFLLAPDGTVLHCLLGYWHPDDLLHELAFAQELNAVWSNTALTRAQKETAFRQRHLAHSQTHTPSMVARSTLQRFDVEHERALFFARKLERGATAAVITDRDGHPLQARLTENAFGKQLVFLSPDERVLHCVVGTWNVHDLTHEIVFAQKMNKVWQNTALTLAEKEAKFRTRHSQQANDWPAEAATQPTSQLLHQRIAERPFVAWSEFDLSAYTDAGQLTFALEAEWNPEPETVTENEQGELTFKTTDVVLHERMARRPFVHYHDFDTFNYCRFGRLKYDKPPLKERMSKEEYKQLKADGKIAWDLFFDRYTT